MRHRPHRLSGDWHGAWECHIEPDWLLELFPTAVKESTEAWWDAAAERAIARSRLAYDGLVLVESDGTGEDSALEEVLAKAALAAGPRSFAPEGVLDRWLARARFAGTADPSIMPPDDAEVVGALRQACVGRRSFAELRESFMTTLEGRLDARSRGRVAALAPDRVSLLGGRAVRVEYETGKTPWIASRLQDFFGMSEGPKVAEGRVPLVLHLLAPNQRAVQVTAELSGFWTKHYPAIRKELARKYPRHSWPEDPRQPAPPMRPRPARG